jgi:iron(III) transport system substrate-binding protein
MKRASIMVAAAVLALAGCASGSTDQAADGDSEALVVYSGRNEQLVGPIMEQFTQDTGIEVDVRYGDTPGMAAQLLEEGDRTPADVFLAQDAGALGAVSAEGLFAPLPAETIAAVPAKYRAADGTWTGVTGRARVIVYNPELVAPADVPTTVAELTDPKWDGTIGLAPSNASFQSFVTAMRVAEGDPAAQAWLDGIAANNPKTYERNGNVLDAVDAGEVALGLINHYYWFEKAAEVGEDNLTAQLAYTAPGDPGSLVNVSGVGVLAGSADDPQAQEFVQYMLSPAAQEYFAEETAEYPLIAGVATVPGLVPLDQLQGPDIDLGDLASLPVTIEMIQQSGLL